MTQVMFETFNISGMYMQRQEFLAMVASGRTSGIVLNIGDGVCSVMPMYDSCCIERGVYRSDFAGRDITNYLSRILKYSGYSFTETAELQTVRDIKEKLAYCAFNYEDEVKNVEKSSSQFEKNYELPDGQIITIGIERFKCTEVLFKTELIDEEMIPIHTMVTDSIMECPIDIRRDLFSNIILSGGTTMFPGFTDRLSHEIKQLAYHNVKVKGVAPPDRKYSVWIGGSILSAMSYFQNLWITKDQYDERGPGIINVSRRTDVTSTDTFRNYIYQEDDEKKEDMQEKDDPQVTRETNADQQLYDFLKTNAMEQCLENSIELFEELNEENILYFVDQCKQMKNEMNKFKNEYGISSVLYEKLSKYGIVTIDILCNQVKDKNDLKTKFKITDNAQCDKLWNIIITHDNTRVNEAKQEDNDESPKSCAQKQFDNFLEKIEMKTYFDGFRKNGYGNIKLIELFAKYSEKDALNFVRQSKQMKYKMEKFKNEYAISSSVFQQLSKSGIVTVDILCKEVIKKIDLKKKFGIMDDVQCNKLWDIVMQKANS
eukprot:537063_1